MGTITYFGDGTSGAFLIIASVSQTKITRFHGPITVFNSVTSPRVLLPLRFALFLNNASGL